MIAPDASATITSHLDSSFFIVCECTLAKGRYVAGKVNHMLLHVHHAFAAHSGTQTFAFLTWLKTATFPSEASALTHTSVLAITQSPHADYQSRKEKNTALQVFFVLFITVLLSLLSLTGYLWYSSSMLFTTTTKKHYS